MRDTPEATGGTDVEYLVGFHADTLGVLMGAHRLMLNLPGARILAVNSVPESESVPQGLRVLVTLRAKSIEDAVEKAGRGVEHLSDGFAFGLAAAVGECRPEFAVDYSETAESRLVYQRIHMPPALRPMRTLNPLSFVSVMGYLQRVASRNQHRLQRAVAWLRKSYDQENPCDEFINLWMGLEAVNRLVAEKHSLQDAEESFPCPHCGKGIGKHDTKAGVNYVVRQLMGQTHAVAKRLAWLRNALLHSFEPVDDLYAQLEELLPLARCALVYSIMDSADVPRDRWDEWTKVPLARRNECYIELFSEADGMTRGHMKERRHLPLYRLKSAKSKHGYDALGRVRTDSGAYLEVGPLPYSLTLKSQRVNSTKDPEDETAKVELTEVRHVMSDKPIEPPDLDV